MTILFDGRFETTGNFSGYNRYAGYGSNLGPNGIYDQGAPPDGIDRLLLMDDPLGSGETVLRCYLASGDPVGNWSAGGLRSELSHTIGASEDNFEETYWYSWWFMLPSDWIIDSEPYESSPYTSILQLHDTPDGEAGTGIVPSSVDAGADTVTFGAGVVWPDRTMVRWQSLGGTIPAPFVEDTSYYVINPSASTTIKLASSYANAEAGTAVNISSAGSGSFRLYDQTRSPNFMLRARAGFFEIQTAYENIFPLSGVQRRLISRMPIQLGKWINCTVRVRWSFGSTGTLAVWFGDQAGIRQIFNDALTINAWNDAESRGGDGVYPTCGCYARAGLPTGVASRMVYHKGVQTGDSSETVQSISGVPELESFVVAGVSA